MGSIASIIAEGPRPTRFGILTPDQQQGIQNTLAQQRASVGQTNQNIALTQQHVIQAKQEAEARARAMRDQEILTRGMAEIYGKKPESNTISPDVSVEQGAPASEPPGNSLGAGLGPAAAPENSPEGPTNSLAAGMPPAVSPPSPPEQPAARGPAGLPTPAKMTPSQANDALEAYAVQNGISAPGLIAWKKQRQAMEEGAEKLTKEQRDNLLGQHAMERAALEAVDAETDPNLRQQAAARAAKVVPGFDPSDTSPAKIQSLIHGLEIGGGILKERHDKATVAELEAKAKTAERANIAAPLAAAAESGEEAYKAAYDRLDPKIQKELPSPDDYDPETTPDQVRAYGSPIALQVKTAQQKEREQRLRDTAGMVNDQRMAMVKVAQDRAKTYAARNGAGGNNAQGIAFRFNKREADNIDKEEARLHLQVNDLAQAIGSKSLTNFSTGIVTTIPDTAPYERRLGGLKDRLQTLQINKAKNFGLEAPDKASAQGVVEGGKFNTPDGSVWVKRDGVMYWDRGPGTAPAAASPANATPAQAQPTAVAPAAASPAAPSGVIRPGAPNPFGLPGKIEPPKPSKQTARAARPAQQAQAAPRKINPKTGQVITLKNGQWVDEKTQQPVQ